ncbi:hypothetical protein PUR61_36155 [Streptomyces sp. BE20]|uniref:hypothetical protein n=1 Tax=Streptomyces sp. BE20 TaxID=3002525 RepID=UPI002E794350|nr:hypothetical protein [Streptomyces sp. BE20]MEE1827574.1 hypothetical protein [Streptomyces sp. BE20]
MSAPESSPSAADQAQQGALDPAAVPGPGSSDPALPDPAASGPAAFDPAPAPAPVARRTLPRALGVTLAAAGLIAVTATSAAVTVAVGRPDPEAAVVAGTAARPGPAAATSAPPTAPPTTSPTASPTVSAPASTAAPAPAPAPKPASTVRGTVNGGKHEGDLRYFLLPIPEGGESYGPADGMTLTDEEVADEFNNRDTIMRILRAYGYKDAATRTYRTADGKAEVTVTLLRFGSAGDTKEFAEGYTMSLEPMEITGDPGARGYVRTPKQQAYTGSMTGISSQGDVQYTIDVDVKGTPDKALLSELMRRQRAWLTSGG